MKTLLIATFMSFPFVVLAKRDESDFSRAQTLWSDFRNCKSQVQNELKLINCVEGLMSTKITRYEKGKLTSLLAMGFSFSDLFECGEVKNLLPTKPSPDENYFCMHVLGNKSKLPGFIIVTTEKNIFRLNAIKYNDVF
jgi:hypothetical protein